jgi:hypothetical protein
MVVANTHLAWQKDIYQKLAGRSIGIFSKSEDHAAHHHDVA